MMSTKDKRVYEEIGGGWAMPTDYVQNPEGVLEKSKYKGKPEPIRVEQIKREGFYLRGKGVGAVAGNSGSHLGDYNHKIGINQNPDELIELVVTLAATEEADGYVNLGASDDANGYVTNNASPDANVTITGFADENSVEALGKLAYTGTVKIMSIHAQASDKSFFDNALKATGYKPNGDIAGQKTIQWEKINSKAETQDVRENTFPGGLCLQGLQHLRVGVKKGTNASLTLYVKYTPNR